MNSVLMQSLENKDEFSFDSVGLHLNVRFWK